MTFYLTDAMRNRARAAYRQTSYDERDTSWSEMINKALLAEVQRRERAYNGGQAFVGNDEPLTPGRPIGF
ncbi:ParB family protein [Leifsonia xyli]|uniref:ParB family protein n=1 Tax=Leifsonia xyli TaxID=1575 RepID=UPI0026963EB1